MTIKTAYYHFFLLHIILSVSVLKRYVKFIENQLCDSDSYIFM